MTTDANNSQEVKTPDEDCQIKASPELSNIVDRWLREPVPARLDENVRRSIQQIPVNERRGWWRELAEYVPAVWPC
jgi:hypothetical protein